MSGSDWPIGMTFCAGCKTIWAIELQVAPVERDPHWLCPSCRKADDRARRRLPLTVGSRCVHLDYQHGPGSVLIITSAEGDRRRVHPLGLPQFPGHDGRSVYHRRELVGVPW